MNRLVIACRRHPYPYVEDRDPGDWGEISMQVEDANGSVIRRFLRQQWHLTPLKEWLVQNRVCHISESPPPALVGRSIAHAISTFYRTETDEEDEAFEIVEAYRARHGVRFALRGTDVADVYIGRFDDELQVSFWGDGSAPWCYEVEIWKPAPQDSLFDVGW